MVSLLTVARAPELIDEVLDYLDPKDTVSLLLTCRTLYPLCNRQLWSNLRLYQTESQEDCTKDLCKKLLTTIQTNKIQRTGLVNTKKIILHYESLNRTGGFVESGLIQEFGTLLSCGYLSPHFVELHLPRIDVNKLGFNLLSYATRAPRMSEQLKDKLRTCEKVTWFLGCLKDVSSRIQHNFSLSVHVPLDPEVLNTWRLLDISKITEITVDIDWKINHPRDQYLQVRTEDGYDLDASYANTQLSHTLSTFLREAPNIRKLWISTSFDYYEGQKRGYGDLEASDSLEDLQDAFTSLSKLQILSIRGKFFHPSFFITPPDSTRTVIYEGVFSDKWFNQFCQCHFVNVTNMTVELTAQDPKFAMVQRNAEFEYSPYSVQDVAFTGIQNCRLELNGLEEVYADTLRQAVLRRNRGLHIPSKERLSGSIAENARKIAEASLNHACSNYISIASARLTSTPKTLDNETEESQIQNCVQQCIRTLPKSLENLESWEVATSDSKKMLVQSEARIKNLIMMAAPQFVLESTEERLNGNENPDPDEVTMKLLKNMMKVLKNEKAWRKNQKKTLRFSRQCRAQLEREIEAGVKIATGERVIETITQGEYLPIEDVYQRLTQDVAEDIMSTKMDIESSN
ncbi:hypothetical protein TWF106_000864 [Orbilia oligospora]|uniref:F-box domain-containing protein n=1 Tax=Orbilia oligospora TaxID=2813651 RepID=A0A7C8QU56_ORBOL|nr:hypothetical protein TWF106_000864 [Orbilia oligospora]